jgi:serine/threonine protein kinase/tetratricopeptide (TPR) repeat protein
MATVFLAIQENFQREVALKIMSPVLSEDKNFSDRFLREARIVSSLVHPNIVTVHDVGIENGHHYLSMEYIEGHDLKACLPTFTGKQIFRVMKEVASALDYAGRKGYVHRDVKPENIMIHDQDGRAILMDFGIARAADAVSSMTQTGTALGTPHYMSPEQARGHAIDGRSDLYSLGILLYFMMVGEVPFEADSAVAIGIKHVSAAIPVLPDALKIYQPLIEKLLAKKPEQRFQSGAELLDALEHSNVVALDNYIPSRTLAIASRVNDTPVRNEAASDDPKYKTPESKEVGFNQKRGIDRSNDTLAAEPREALHIPREDIDDRQGKKSGSSVVSWLLLLLVTAVGSSYYAHNEGLIRLPVQLLPDHVVSLLGLKIPAPSSGLADNHAKKIQPNANGRGVAVAESTTQIGVDSIDGQIGQTSASVATSLIDSGLALSPVDALLAEVDSMKQLVADKPEKTEELLVLYRQILALDPENVTINSAYETTKTQGVSKALSLSAEGDLDGAEDALQQAVEWFPELAEQSDFLDLHQSLKSALQVNELLELAEGYLKQDYLIGPVGKNAREMFEQVLVLDPDNSQAYDGMEQIVARYLVLAQGARARGDFDKAQTFVSNGLRVDVLNTDLLDLGDGISSDQIKEQQIADLLQSANTLSQRQQWFGDGDNATRKYQAVLLIDPSNQAARDGLSTSLDEFISEVGGLIAIKDYDLAEDRIQMAMELLPDSDGLILLAQQLESARPAITRLLLSGRPISADTEGSPSRFSAYRTLHIVFNFKNLSQATTVFQVRLFDAVRSTQIAAVPVVVAGEQGSTQVRINRPVEGFSEGGYHIDILLAGKRIYTSAFVIDN